MPICEAQHGDMLVSTDFGMDKIAIVLPILPEDGVPEEEFVKLLIHRWKPGKDGKPQRASIIEFMNQAFLDDFWRKGPPHPNEAISHPPATARDPLPFESLDRRDW